MDKYYKFYFSASTFSMTTGYWPDYILATHHHANVLALSGSPETTEALARVSGVGPTQRIQSQRSSPEQISRLDQAPVSFVENCRRELRTLESNFSSAEMEVKSLEARASERGKPSKKKGDEDESAKRDFAFQWKIAIAQAKITKASKDSGDYANDGQHG